MTLRVENREIKSQPFLRYLGVSMPDSISNNRRCHVGTKASVVKETLSRIISYVRGPKQKKRELDDICDNIYTHIQNICLVWYTQNTGVTQIDREIYRKSVLEITSAFRTISQNIAALSSDAAHCSAC
ncbi:hypothetical protein EVAR_49743_1 [Eumeta japonica]|uniref:Uncharacterized protein n=1 Tax=Eumeta variegata TaxID=151549 RepID=A0A4C1Y9V8_EUMVA|nr:hypothetical protein EVAR_49743_1 [Eumeta japonica]